MELVLLFLYIEYLPEVRFVTNYVVLLRILLSWWMGLSYIARVGYGGSESIFELLFQIELIYSSPRQI